MSFSVNNLTSRVAAVATCYTAQLGHACTDAAHVQLWILSVQVHHAIGLLCYQFHLACLSTPMLALCKTAGQALPATKHLVEGGLCSHVWPCWSLVLPATGDLMLLNTQQRHTGRNRFAAFLCLPVVASINTLFTRELCQVALHGDRTAFPERLLRLLRFK